MKNEINFIRELNATIPAILLFVSQKMASIKNADDNSEGEDQWHQFSDTIDLQFAINDDPDAISFPLRREVWAYPMGVSNTGDPQTNTEFSQLIYIDFA